MLNFAKVCLCGAVALILAFSGAPAQAGLSTNCLATDGSNASLLLQIKKNKKHGGQSQNDSGLTDCTIVQPGGGGGCKGGFKYVCEKMKSGDKCCGCVADKNAKQAPTQAGQKAEDNVLWGDYFQTDPQQAPAQGQDPGTDASQQKSTEEKADGRFGVDFDAVPPAQ